MVGVSKQFEMFWKALEKPDGYTRRCGRNPRVGEGPRDLVRRANGTIIYELWGHPIASLTEGVLTLSDEGWETLTTKDRINGILHNSPTNKLHDFHIEQENRIWYLVYRRWSERAGRVMECQRFKWNNGVQIALDNPFRLLEKTTEEEIEAKAKKLRGRVKFFVDHVKKKVEKGTLSMDGGECWGIKMGIQECGECEFLLKPGCGGGITLIAKALQEKGYAYPGIWVCDIDGKEKLFVSLDKIKQNWKYPIGPALRDYVRKRLVKMEFERRKADAA